MNIPSKMNIPIIAPYFAHEDACQEARNSIATGIATGWVKLATPPDAAMGSAIEHRARKLSEIAWRRGWMKLAGPKSATPSYAAKEP